MPSLRKKRQQNNPSTIRIMAVGTYFCYKCPFDFSRQYAFVFHTCGKSFCLFIDWWLSKIAELGLQLNKRVTKVTSSKTNFFSKDQKFVNELNSNSVIILSD